MKTPDEIKKALECCFYDSAQCGECPYYPVSCDRELVRDAREYIRQLEERAHQLDLLNLGLLVEKAQLEAERDAAVDDLQMGVCCGTCAYDDTDVNEQPCATCARATTFGNWEWRGVPKEE